MPDFSGSDLLCVRGGRAVFEGLSFHLSGGDALLVTGANGAGKSSLLRLMAGLLRARGGAILWDGRPIDDASDDHSLRVHYVGHLDAVKPALTVAENLAFWAGLEGTQSLVPSALEAMGLESLADVPGRFLSAGQRRRVALARLAAMPRPLWLLDEPATALDAPSLERLSALIVAHRMLGGMIIAASHADLDLPGAETLQLGEAAA